MPKARIPYKNHIGQKYNKLTILDFEKRGKRGYYLCKCDCGELKWIGCDHILDSKTKSCGCERTKERHTDMSGMKFGRLTIIKEVERRNGRIAWECKCDCGNTIVITSENLKYGHTQSCGCYQRERAKEAHTKHGDTKSRLFMILQDMKARCYNPKNNRYYRYGARGICICEKWLDKENGYINFKKWAIENGYADNLTIDRIDVNGNYEPENCKWSTNKEQSNNRSTNRYIEYNGQKKTMSEWSDITGIAYHTIQNRLNAKKTLNEVFKK